MKNLLLIAIVSWMLLGNTTAAWALDAVNVRLFEAYPGIHQATLVGPFELQQPVRKYFPARRYQLSLRQGQVYLLQNNRPILHGNSLILENATLPGVGVQAEKGPPLRHYPGRLIIRSSGRDQLQLINEVPVRTYVTLVVGSETPPNWPTEALKAQAVLTHTGLKRYQPGKLLGDSTQREIYLGGDRYRPEVARAVANVWNMTLTWKSQPVPPFYHASCAGHTSDGRFFSDKSPLPWLSNVPCPWDRQSVFFKPTIHTIPAAAFTKAFPEGLPLIIKKDNADRPLKIRLGNQSEISGYDFWLRLGQRLGWDKLPGTRYSISRLANGQIRLQSTGAGHGVGLCQWGAAGMARQGKSYRDILHYYFPKLSLTEQAD